MKMTLNVYQFIEMWPESRKDQFSYNGKKALFNYLEEYEEQTGEQVEFDPVALCCEYEEHKDATTAASNYFEFKDMTFDPKDGGELKTAEEVEKEAIAFLEKRTTLLQFDGGIIIQSF